MSIFIIVFLSCSIGKDLKCAIDYSKTIYSSQIECDHANELHLIKGQCVELKRDQEVEDEKN